jgi:hypothetical protein
MVAVIWPVSNHPGQKPQEGSGKLINVFAEPRGGDLGPVWRRVPGAAVFAREPSAGSASGSATALGVSSVVLITGSAAGSGTAAAVGEAT